MAETTYQKRVIANLKHMGTPAEEWSAVPIVGEEKVEADGRERNMPVFKFPSGYDKAPTLYPVNRTGDLNCELCGKMPIKTAYHIQNDRHKWLLLVGSECVTHFQEKSGKEEQRGFRLREAEVLAKNLSTIRKYIRENYSEFKMRREYGREVKQMVWRSSYVGEQFNFKNKEQIRELVKSGVIDDWFDKRDSFKENIYWLNVFKKMPYFADDYSSEESREKALLSWYKRNEEKAKNFIASFVRFIELERDDKIELESLPSDKKAFGGLIDTPNYSYSIGGL
jgi:hypothetical protein